MKIDIQELHNRWEYINSLQKDDLIIFNYNHTCQYAKAWNEYTTMARGLITDEDGNIIARPLPKFFNLNETEETKLENLPNEKPEIYEKLDGSLGIQYFADDKIMIATRGSFNSEQAEWATKWIQKRFKPSDFNKDYTYLYEIIYPENRIVVNYGDRKELVLIAVIDTETGKDMDFVAEAKRLGLTHAKVINKSLDDLVKSMSDENDDEGFVVKYSNGLRLKMKYVEYVRLHRLITGFSTTSIWECMKNDDDLDELIEKVPDEFYKWVRMEEKELREHYDVIQSRALKVFAYIRRLKTRKEQAERIIQLDNDVSSIVFGMLDGKEVDELIFKRIKPKWELPFKDEI